MMSWEVHSLEYSLNSIGLLLKLSDLLANISKTIKTMTSHGKRIFWSSSERLLNNLEKLFDRLEKRYSLRNMILVRSG
jgi:hypothetical protein